jgi:hypothetical protein
MARNRHWVWTEGQIGIERRGMVSDADGRVDLDNFDSVHLLVSRTTSSTPVIDMATVDRDPNQSDESSETSGKGWFTYTTDADAAAITPGAYLLNIVGLLSGTRIYFPQNINDNQAYARLIIKKSLSA